MSALLALASSRLHIVPTSPAEAIPADPTQRKGPHTLRLVQAAAEPRRAPRPVQPVTAPRQTVRVVRMPEPEPAPEAKPQLPPELAFYRSNTEGMLRRYRKMALERGRVPSPLGQGELFRGRVTSCRVQGFDDAVIFVHDIDRCLGELGAGERCLLQRIAVQEYTLEEAAAMLGLSLRTAIRYYRRALDGLTALLLERGLLEKMGVTT